MKTVQSKDGTTIAYDQIGRGPPLVLVDGAFCYRGFGPMPKLAARLAQHFTVLFYDRRGRGESSDTAPYAVSREIEDLAAIVEAAGGSALLYGISSGAALAMRAVASGVRATKLVVYEPPFALDGTRFPDPPDYREQIGSMIAAGHRDDAVKLFMKVVGAPAFVIFLMRLFPNVWPKLRAVAHTLPHDLAVLGDTQRGAPVPADLRRELGSIATPTLSLAGGRSAAWMHHAARVVSEAIPGASFRLVPGQDHNVAAKAVAPFLVQFFGSPQEGRGSAA